MLRFDNPDEAWLDFVASDFDIEEAGMFKQLAYSN